MTLSITHRGEVAEAALPVEALAAQLRLADGWDAVPGQRARLALRLRASAAAVGAQADRAVLRQSVVLEGRAPGGNLLILPLAPVASVTAVAADGRAIPLTDARWRSDGGRTHLALPRALLAGAEVRVEVEAGFADWAAVPAALADAVLTDAEAREVDVDLAGAIAQLVAPFRTRRLGGGA